LLTVKKPDTNPVTQFFPVQEPPPPDVLPEETTSSEIDRNIKAVLTSAISPAEERHSKAGPGQSTTYKSYRTPGDLSSTAKKLFEMAGTSPYLVSGFIILTAPPANVSGTELDTLVRAVYMLEQRIIVWQKQQRKIARRSEARV
jgi:RNA polymerase I-specific transcription initiation factor RRN7